MASAESARQQPLDVAMEFIKRVNSGDVNALCELMTPGHIFQDALGKRFIGRETMREGWTAYFKTVADYQIHAEEFFQTDERMAIFVTASGRATRKSCCAREKLPSRWPKLCAPCFGRKPGGKIFW